MRNLSPASDDLGLGDGDLLSQQVSDAEEERKKKLLKLGNTQDGANQLGLAAMSLLGGFHG